ncbi:MAG: AsmA family protein [Gallionella sp.]|nr:AsmA family protein [Gallionella sp.]
MKWLKRILLALVLLLVIAAVLPFLISLNDYLPQIEKIASDRLKEPVTIDSIRLSVLPLPHVMLSGITVGKNQDIKLDRVRVTPDIYSLFQTTRVIKRIEIDTLILTQQAISNIQAWISAGNADNAAQVRLESIHLNNVRVNLGKASLGPFEARVNLNSKGEPLDATITAQDGQLKVFIKSDGSTYQLEVSAKSWTLPLGPALVFDELLVRGVATLSEVNLSAVNARLYGGMVGGKATLNWQKGWRINGNFDINQVELQKIVPMLSSKARISGKLSAKPLFSASATSAGQLMKALRLKTAFNVQHGVLHGVDIQKAATHLGKQGAVGGETRFDNLSGYLVREGGSHRFTQLKIASGALAVDGQVNVSPKKELSGRINAQVKVMGASAGVPLNVAGTVAAPLLYPTAGIMTGAAIGTVLLGPGVGTSVGAKVGVWVEGLFGKKEENKAKK